MLQQVVEMLDDVLAQFFLCLVDHIVDCPEMVNGFQNVIHKDSISDINGVGLENESCLIFCQFTALDMVGVVGHATLQLVIQTAG